MACSAAPLPRLLGSTCHCATLKPLEWKCAFLGLFLRSQRHSQTGCRIGNGPRAVVWIEHALQSSLSILVVTEKHQYDRRCKFPLTPTPSHPPRHSQTCGVRNEYVVAVYEYVFTLIRSLTASLARFSKKTFLFLNYSSVSHFQCVFGCVSKCFFV